MHIRFNWQALQCVQETSLNVYPTKDIKKLVVINEIPFNTIDESNRSVIQY